MSTVAEDDKTMVITVPAISFAMPDDLTVDELIRRYTVLLMARYPKLTTEELSWRLGISARTLQRYKRKWRNEKRER